MSQTNQVSLIPALNNFIVDRIGDGSVTNNTGTIENVPAALANLPQSSWWIAQWNQPEILDSSDYIQNDPSTFDPLYGNALYSWNSPTTNEAFSIYQNTEALGGGYVYDLTGGDGLNEADIFLSASTISQDKTLDHPINLSLNAKISQATFDYSSGFGPANGTNTEVGGNVDIGFTVNFNGMDGLPKYSGFVQIIPMTSSVVLYGIFAQYFGASSGYQNSTSTPPISTNPADATQFIYSNLMSGDTLLPLIAADSSAAPETLNYNVNKYVYAAIGNAFVNFPSVERDALMNLSNWTLGSIYIGIASDNQQTNTSPEGSVSLSLQVSDLSLTADTSQNYDPNTVVPSTPAVDPNPQIQFFDATAGIGGSADGSSSYVYETNAFNKYVYTGTDAMFLVAPSGTNWLFGGGSGTTCLTAYSGDNIFLASTGSSFMSGGSGNDTFNIPDANVTGNSVWDTIKNFHPGDSVDLAGLAGAGWSFSWLPDSGAVGSTGLTLFAQSTLKSGLSELVTFDGLDSSMMNSLGVSMDADTSALVITDAEPQTSNLGFCDYSTNTSGSDVCSTSANISGIQAQYIYMGSDVMCFIAPPGVNWKFGGGSGETVLSATSGNNIFVASTSSSFMIGGTGNDIFQIPDANIVGKSVWDTIRNFHAGDTVELSGLSGAGWTYSWLPDMGASGSTGLTLFAQSTMAENVNEIVTFAGLQASDLASISLSQGSGSSAGELLLTR